MPDQDFTPSGTDLQTQVSELKFSLTEFVESLY